MYCRWKPIERYLFYNGFPNPDTEDEMTYKKQMIFVLFRYIPITDIYHYLHRVHSLYRKDTILVNLYQCEDFLLVMKKKHVYLKEDFSCMIGICAINPMKSPYFISTFYETHEDMYATTAMEYIQGVTFETFMIKLFQEDESESFTIFLTLVLQILFSLDFAQLQISFTHFDLHLRNIMIEATEEPFLEFSIGSSTYRMEYPRFKVKIIDFEFACVKVNDKVIANVYESIFQYGYLSIFLPGVDMLRLMMELRVIPKANSKLGKTVNKFLDDIFTSFYRFEITELWTDLLKKHQKNFFNMTFTKQIYYCPFELILHLDQYYSKEMPFHKTGLDFYTTTKHDEYPTLTNNVAIVQNCIDSLKDCLKKNNAHSVLQKQKWKRIITCMEQFCEWRCLFPNEKLCDEKCYPYLKIEKKR